MVSFTGPARPLTARDVQNAAAEIGCEVAALRAVLAVESRNSGFDAKRRPIILFEPHVFWRQLSGPAREEAYREGLAYQKWGAKPYPRGQDAQYDRLSRAAKIDEEAAFRSISVGLGQVLGENYAAAGCSSAVEMFEQARESEAAQLGHMLGFIRARRIDDDLRNKNWETFARVYNGPGQVKKYSAWLAREYAKWAKIVAKPRAELTAADLKAAGSKTIEGTSAAKTGLGVMATAGAGASALSETVQGVSGPIEDAAEHVRSAHGALAWLQDNWRVVGVVLLALLAAYGVWSIWRGIKAAEDERVRNARDGVNERI
jgi:hypothetical protein